MAGSEVTAITASEVTMRGRGHLGSGGGRDRARSRRWRLDLREGKLGGEGERRLGGDGGRGQRGRGQRDEGSEVNRWGAGFSTPHLQCKNGGAVGAIYGRSTTR